MVENDLAKHQQVRDAIVEKIRSGEFEPGQKLPSERDLAAQLGVSYMTARRAVSAMVEADLLERRSRTGTFIGPDSHYRLATTTLNLVCAAYGVPLLDEFLRLGAKAAAAQGWQPHILRLYHGHNHLAVRAIEQGELTLVLASGPELEGPLGKAMRGAQGRAVLIGNRLDDEGVPSVLADDALAMHLAVERLRAAGHRAIGLVSDQPEHTVDRVQVAAWRFCCANLGTAAELESRLIVVGTPRFECQTAYTYEAVRRCLSAPQCDVTALICLGDEMALATLAACRDVGRPVPEQMSLINSGDSALLAFAHPPLTCVDIHLDQHIEQAMALLDAAQAGRSAAADRLRLIEPHLVERGSVAPVG